MGLVCLLSLLGVLWMRKSCSRLRKWKTKDNVSYIQVEDHGSLAVGQHWGFNVVPNSAGDAFINCKCKTLFKNKIVNLRNE